MKNRIIIIGILLLSFSASSQSPAEQEVRATIEAFFMAFHQQDTLALKAMAKGNIKMQSISVDQKGEPVLNENSYEQFVSAIGSIPKERKFREKLLGFTIKVDAAMANAWTPYEFWVDEQLSHCGVNSFQLMKEEGVWKIIYLVDTRRRVGCE